MSHCGICNVDVYPATVLGQDRKTGALRMLTVCPKCGTPCDAAAAVEHFAPKIDENGAPLPRPEPDEDADVAAARVTLEPSVSLTAKPASIAKRAASAAECDAGTILDMLRTRRGALADKLENQQAMRAEIRRLDKMIAAYGKPVRRAEGTVAQPEATGETMRTQ